MKRIPPYKLISSVINQTCACVFNKGFTLLPVREFLFGHRREQLVRYYKTL